MNHSPILQTIGNGCVALATVVFLAPLQRSLWRYADKHLSDDRWVPPILRALVPLWLLLMGALLCVTAQGGFDGLRLGRPMLYALTAAASAALAVVTFVFIGLYIRPGFTPSVLYAPVIYLTPFTTGLLAVLILNQKLMPGIPVQWLRWPWTLFAAFSLVVCLGFLGYRLINTGLGGGAELVRRILTARDTTPDQLAKIASVNPQGEFGFLDLLHFTSVYRDREVREAATARLRALPDFTTRLAGMLKTGRGFSNTYPLEFLEAATLSSEEQTRLAAPTRAALENFIGEIPAPNFTTRQRQKQILKWGRKTIPVIIRKFTGTDVDFSRIMPEFEEALRPDDSRR